MVSIGRNDPCPCGSGKKYKTCHIGVPPREVAVSGSNASNLRSLDSILLDSCTPSISVGVESIVGGDFKIMLGICQYLVRLSYLGLEGESEEKQREVLDAIKEMSLLLMVYDSKFSSTYPNCIEEIRDRYTYLAKFVKGKRGLAEKFDELFSIDLSNLSERYTRSKVRSFVTHEDSLDPAVDIAVQNEYQIKGYKQRLSRILTLEDNPLVVGILVGGAYTAATFYLASLLSKKKPDFVLVKKSRYERGLSVFPTEARKIREAISSDRDIIVVDDIVHSFKSFFVVYDYFSQPRNMRFSARFYNSPLPRELNILERDCLSSAAVNKELADSMDQDFRGSLATILQYGCSIDRDERQVKVLRPVI